MPKINSSPDRHTFQKEGYVRRCEEEGKEPNPDYIQMYKTWREQDQENIVDPEWQEFNLEYDLRSTDWICSKVCDSEVYAQHLYAAMCNNDFQKNDVWPTLKGDTWSCSWRHAGGIIADMREQGDYIEWYCSGIRGQDLTDLEFNNLTQDQQLEYKKIYAFVPEGVVTDEVRADLLALGWRVIDDDQAQS